MDVLLRAAHIGSAAVLVGGAALVWALTAGRASTGQETRSLALVAQRSEWLFWGALGVLVATGVGNLAQFGEGLPDPATPWGRRLTLKLLLVLVLAAVSVARALYVVRLVDAASALEGDSQRRALRNVYALTALLAVAVLALATWLAHG